ncbi:MAG: iron ABC transporter permease, partial [Gemmatimonadetes bacterium]|nr:iron ABC transporter permease [Gemmatimonadota bacterium]
MSHPRSGLAVPRGILLAAPIIIILLWLVLFPNVWVLGDSFMDGGRFTTEHYARFFGSGSELQALWASVWISLASVVLSGAVGVPLAFLFARRDFPGRK